MNKIIVQILLIVPRTMILRINLINKYNSNNRLTIIMNKTIIINIIIPLKIMNLYKQENMITTPLCNTINQNTI